MRRRELSVRAAGAAVFLAALLAPARGLGQQVPYERVVPLKEQVEGDLKRARFRLGPIRLLPTLTLENAGWTNNALGTPEGEPDWHLTARGGTRLVVPLGHSAAFRGEALPTYTWYHKLVERRSFGGTYGAELALFSSRLSGLVGARHSRDTQIVSTEIYQPVPQTDQTGYAQLELSLFRRIALVGYGEARRLRLHPPDDATVDFTFLNSDFRAVRGGLKYRFADRIDISAQVEGTRTTYPLGGELRDNETTAYLLGIGYDRERFYINLLGGYREGGPYAGSAFPEYSGPTGSAFLSWFLARRLELQLYAQRNLTSSLHSVNPYYVETVGGGALNLKIGHRITLRGFAEVSRNRYPLDEEVDGVLVRREDDGRALGGGFIFRLFRSASFSALVSHTRFDSNIPGAERSILMVNTNLTFDLFRYGEP